MDFQQEARNYHAHPKPGKLAIRPTKPFMTQHDLSLAYSPGVAVPCLDIAENPDDVYRYTARGNLVAVISNGSAVLGLGNIGALAGKPVMEGKAILFKRFANIDVFDIELDISDLEEFIAVVKTLEPTFGGINLEDIKAPECFEIERRLQEMMDIPVFHDDQHGTAIISGAAMLNGCLIQEKKMEDLRIVMSGAGAAGIACAKFYISLGADPANITMCDSQGVIYQGRTERMNPLKQEWAIKTDARTLADAIKGADVFAGLSVANTLTQEMVASMADRPMVFAMANPDPEIMPDKVAEVRSDAIVATGRSDFPNQVNNVLGFPFIFRGALDVNARKINEEMKRAACESLANLAREDVPDSVLRAYGVKSMRFGSDYIIPKPFDPRVLTAESSAVAEAAVQTGVARKPIEDFQVYRERLAGSLSRKAQFMQSMRHRARGTGKRILFTDGDHPTIIRAVNIIRQEQLAIPVLVGRPELIQQTAGVQGIDLDNIEIIAPETHPKREKLAQAFYDKRQRRGSNLNDARYLARVPDRFAALLLEAGEVDGLVCGIGRSHQYVMRALLQILPLAEDSRWASGMYIVLTDDDILFLADCTAQVEPTAEMLADTALRTAKAARVFDQTPRVAMLSFSNYGSSEHPEAVKVRKAVEIVKATDPNLCVDGEVQIDTALSPEMQQEHFPFSELRGRANVLIFPSLSAGLLATKLLVTLTEAEAVGPLTTGFSKPVNVLHLSTDVEHVVSAAAMTAIEAIDGAL